MYIEPWPRRDPPRPASRALRAVALSAVTLAMGVALWGAWFRPGLELHEIVPEGYMIFEWGQMWLWIGIGITAGIACGVQKLRRGVLLGWWLGVAAGLAAMRELDLHVLLNPTNIHYFGLEPEQAVRFRLDWWTNGSVSPVLKACWAGIFLVVGSLLVLPFAMAGYPWPRRLLRFGGFAWLISSGIGLLGLSYIQDDLLRGIATNALVEEGLEAAGECLLLIGAVLLALRKVRLYGGEPPAKEAAEG